MVGGRYLCLFVCVCVCVFVCRTVDVASLEFDSVPEARSDVPIRMRDPYQNRGMLTPPPSPPLCTVVVVFVVVVD